MNTNEIHLYVELREGRQVWEVERMCRPFIGEIAGAVLTVAPLSFIYQFTSEKGADIRLTSIIPTTKQDMEKQVRSLANRIRGQWPGTKILIISDETTLLGEDNA